MSEVLPLVLIGLAGVALGVLNAYGLWWTTRAVPRVQHPGLLLIGSFLVRMVLTLGPVLWLGRGGAERMIGGVAAFLIARLIAIRVFAARHPLAIEGVER